MTNIFLSMTGNNGICLYMSMYVIQFLSNAVV